MRGQSGTTSLRAVLYMDEIFGYFPPVANPPSKLPLLTLLKQGRAFGLGVVLVTQNPVDLDYKGLSNTGTWFIGRLQTERDKNRVLEGLEGVAAGTGMKFDRAQMEQTLAGLGNRIFVMNNVHEDGPEVFESRWAMSYLRGPLTRSQIKTLMAPIMKQTGAAEVQAASVPAGAASQSVSSGAASAATPARATTAAASPVLPSEISQHFIPVRSEMKGATLVYHPAVFGAAQVRFTDKQIDTTKDLSVVAPIGDGVVAVDWDQATIVDLPLEDLDQSPQDKAQFADLPSPASKAKSYDSWKKDFASWLYRTQKVELLQSPSLGQTSNVDESERDFRVRLQQFAAKLAMLPRRSCGKNLRRRSQHWKKENGALSRRWIAKRNRPRVKRCKPQSRLAPHCFHHSWGANLLV